MPEPAPNHSSSRRPGHFIPIGKDDLTALLRRADTLAECDVVSLARFAELVDAVVHQEYHGKLERLREAYAIFDPDCDVVRLQSVAPEERERMAQRLFDELGHLLEKANFHRLVRSDVQSAIGTMSYWGVNLAVDLDSFSRLDVYARGHKLDTRVVRRWRKLRRREKVDVPLFQRLAVIFRPNDEHHLPSNFDADTIYLRFFKNIPEPDVDMVLPGTRVKMTLFDHSKIVLPTLTGLGVTVWKIVKGALIVAAVGVYGLLAYIGVIIGTLGYGYRSFFGYMRTKEKYQLNLTQNLYYQNLDNNMGVLCRVAAEAEEQEFREAVTAYFFLWRFAPAEGWTAEELDVRTELFLNAQLGRAVDFEVSEALAKLERWGLIHDRGEGRYVACTIAEALARLDESWDNWFRCARTALRPPVQEAET